MNVKKIREDFPVLKRKANGKHFIYLDSTATSLTPIQVIEEVNRYYKQMSSNIHRGLHKLSEEATTAYEESHKGVEKFINAKPGEVVFTRNTTESINAVMYSLLQKKFFKKGDEVLVSAMEHHSNLVPWLYLEKNHGVKLKYIELNSDFTLDLKDFEKKLTRKTKLVSVTHQSNTVGTVNPIKEIGKTAKDYNALFLVDAAQSVPHKKMDVKKLNPDFLAFSGHKMLGPTGIGVLYGKKELLEKMPPFLYGGDMIKQVQRHSVKFDDLPYKFEAGTANIAGALGLKKAVDYLEKIGLEEIESYGKKILKYAFDKLNEVKGLKLYCPEKVNKQGAIILFELKGIDPNDLALVLDEMDNICMRSGMHCAEPLVSSLNKNGLDRASFYLYTTKEEIDVFAEDLKKIGKELK